MKNKRLIYFLTAFMIFMAVVAVHRPALGAVADYKASPPFAVDTVPPLVMLVMSKDEKLFYKAYDDYSDLDDDGVIDTTYKDTINYAGYFNPNECYTYSNTSGSYIFEPSAAATGANSHSCTTKWSGNFLNWATMARIDIVRWVLYGGKRTTDTTTSTVLSRTKLPQEGHSWAKVYHGADIPSFTPYDATFGSDITLCNTNTASADTSSFVFVVKGYFPYSASLDGGGMCTKQYNGGLAITNAAATGTALPLPTATAAAKYNVGVHVCVSGALDSNCLEYKTATTDVYKPTGLLQEFGVDTKSTPETTDDVDQMYFGLISGSYAANLSGGVLRSNIGSMIGKTTGTFTNTEINTDGTISASSKIIKNINNFDIADYTYGSGYSAAGCGLMGPTGISNGKCRSWGDPIGEMLDETIRYFMGKSAATTQFKLATPDTGNNLSGTAFSTTLTTESTWVNPYSWAPTCTKPFALLLADTAPSFDSNEIFGSNWYSTISSASDIPSVNTLLNSSNSDMNTLENIGQIFIGQSDTTSDYRCTSKPTAPSTASFYTIRGVCPEAPAKQGAYYSAPLAWYAHTNAITTAGSQKLTTYSVVTSHPMPKLEYTVNNKKAQILPSFSVGCPSVNYGGKAECTSVGATSGIAGGSPGQLISFKVCTNDTGDADWNIEKSTITTGAISVAFNSGAKSITRTTGSFLTDGFTVGRKITLDAAASNPGPFTIKTVTATVITVAEAVTTVAAAARTITATGFQDCFDVMFDDSAYGADYELDINYRIYVRTDAAANTITVKAKGMYGAAGYTNYAGYIIKGVAAYGTTAIVEPATVDAFGYISNNKGSGEYLDIACGNGNGTSNPPGSNDCDPYNHIRADAVANVNEWIERTFSVTGSGTEYLNDPLWYAAKYGGFKDSNLNNKPDIQSEWDANGDGVPDTYFYASNPLKMRAKLLEAFSDILARSASGTSVSVLATSQQGEGALYQAFFYPQKIMNDGTRRDWVGYCRGFFLDSSGNLREDSDSNARLVLSNDKILKMRLDTSTNEVKADLYNDADEDGDPDPAGSTDTVVGTVDIDDTVSLWEAGIKVAKRDKSTRNIYTWVSDSVAASNSGGFASASGTPMDFTAANNTVLQDYLTAANATEAGNIISFIRGNVVSGYRNRCVPVKAVGGDAREAGCTGSTETSGFVERVWPLGDIVYSTPTTVAAPKEQYDLIYSVTSYTNFRNLYRNRRNVVYVGANDGMLHAINAGVYTAGDDSTTGTGGGSPIEHGWFVANSDATINGFSNGWASPTPTIGDELWAFVPYDNLPHLKWLTQTNYGEGNHVYYVDLKPKITDARIFCDATNADTTPNCINGQGGASHPGGWGTILIAGQRFGGGEISVTISGTGRILRSAYYALDITDPERPPKLLWRFTDANLGFTTSYPGIVHINSSPEKWFMIVGSGPDNTPPINTGGAKGSSSRQGRIFVVNLLNGSTSFTFSNLGINNAGAALDSYAFIGDPTVLDGDLDYNSDVVYIGDAYSTTSGAVATLGKVYRLNTNQDANPANWALSTLINQGKPLLVGPSVSKDSFNSIWTFFGTGRYIDNADKTTSDQQTLYGIKDACWKNNSTGSPCPASANPYLSSSLFNANNLAVCTAAAGGGIYTGSCGSGSAIYSSYAGLLTAARATNGWYLNLAASNPSERVINKSAVLGGLVVFTAFTPNTAACGMLGDSSVYALYYETGTAYSKPVIGTTGTGSSETVLISKSLGKGMPTAIGVAVGKKTKGFIQTSSGTIVEIESQPPLDVRSGPAGWREKSGGGGTVNIEEIYKHIVK